MSAMANYPVQTVKIVIRSMKNMTSVLILVILAFCHFNIDVYYMDMDKSLSHQQILTVSAGSVSKSKLQPQC